MEELLNKWLDKLEYMLMDTLPEDDSEPELLKSQTEEVNEIKQLIKWRKKEVEASEKQALNIDNVMPSKNRLLPLFKDFFSYHNEANKNYEGIDELFNNWYDWKVLENSNLDEKLTKW